MSGILLRITTQEALVALGVPSYADLATANAALTIGSIYYDESLGSLNVTTA